MTYDEDGNLTADGRWVYTWDAENRLIGMTTQTSAVTAGVPNLRLTFAYDAQHRRIQKKTEIYDVPTTSWMTLTDTRFIYDGWNLLVEVEMHNGAKDAPAGVSGPFVRRSYVWGTDISGTWQGAGGVSGLLAVRRHEHGTKPSALYWTAWDLTGNILGMYSGSNVVASYEYDAFGRLLRESEIEEDLNPFRFSTKYTDAETGFAYYGYRFYDAARGRWINRDPIAEKGGENLYGMVKNNPTSWIDMLGMWKIERKKTDKWARALSDKGDSIRSLAYKIYLDPEQSQKWMRNGHTQGVDEELAPGCEFEVPNTFVAIVGDLSYTKDFNKGREWRWPINLYGNLAGWGMYDINMHAAKSGVANFRARMEGDNYRVEEIWDGTKARFAELIPRAELAGFYAIGHGEAGVIHTQDQDSVHSNPWIRNAPHTYSLIYLNVCYSGSPGAGWDSLISKRGSLYAEPGESLFSTGDQELPLIPNPNQPPGTEPWEPFIPLGAW
jgi:RHS repeat-associated protein